MTCTVSIVIPLYNKSAFVLDAVRSVLAQECLPSEIIVIDDGSDDGGAGLVESLRHPLIRIVRQANAGVAAARNRGAALATGDIINFLDADDILAPSYLIEILKLAAIFPAASMYATGYTRLFPNGETRSMKIKGLPRCPQLVDDFFLLWSRGSFTFTSAICVRRSLLAANAIQFPEGERWGEDQDVWFRLAETGDVVYSPTNGVLYRVDVAGSATASEGLRTTILPAYARLAQRLRDQTVPSRLRGGVERLLSGHYLNIASGRLAARDTQSARMLLNDPFARFQRRRHFWLSMCLFFHLVIGRSIK